ncbi:SDR family NAD(P)-dependent oxidoreductase [uncultured Prochlorococcus sp.]|uniref:SDR family NAD(P)-dependent oxidoreductase n=1 Tax=uncultured Prochlorococcus sp. TaxID=159733 RepID=UPI00258553F3|nr:SDR family oxidoreductase [uncultured Prochlorococcus sp.]
MDIFKENALLNKNILITGASSGIGANACKLFSLCGARTILLGRNEEKLKQVISNLNDAYTHAYIISDLSSEDSAYNTIKSLKTDFLPLDGIFHAAGSELVKPINLTKTRDLNFVFNSSVGGALSLSRAISKRGIMKDGGSVIFMSSVAAISGTAGLSAYSAGKAAIGGLLKSLAMEFANRKIRFNSIISGAIESPMHERLIKNMSKKSIEEYRAKHPFGFGSLSDISNLAVFLMSDASKWITGSEIVIDGGYTVS